MVLSIWYTDCNYTITLITITTTINTSHHGAQVSLLSPLYDAGCNPRTSPNPCAHQDVAPRTTPGGKSIEKQTRDRKDCDPRAPAAKHKRGASTYIKRRHIMDAVSPPSSDGPEMDPSARRELLKRMLEDASDESLAKFHKKLCDRRPNICVARATPKKNWTPKHKKATRDALVLLKNGAGIRKAPFESVPDGVNYKVVTAELAEALMFLNEKTSSEKQRSETITISMCVASLLARLAEEANDLSDLAEEEAESGGVIICEKVDRKHAPVWAQMSAKGSGLSCNERGMQRLKSVVLQMHDRLAEDSASASVSGSGEEEAVGDE